MTIRDKNLDALYGRDGMVDKFNKAGYEQRLPMFDATRTHGSYRDVHLEARAKMTGLWPEQRVKKD